MTTVPEAVLADLRQIIDPEIGVNIVDLGLLYAVEFEPDSAKAQMTLTSPVCPMGDMLVGQVRAALARHLPANAPVNVELVWTPVWTPDRMSDAARAALGWS